MSRTLDLLRLAPEAALRQIIADCLVDGVSASAFKLGVPVVVSGKDTTIRLELDRLNVPVDLWINNGIVDFGYPRLDLGVEFAKFLPEVVLDFPATTQSIRNALTKRYGLLFDDNDFVEETVQYADRNAFVLKSKPESLRWVGNYPMAIKQRILELNAAFVNKHMSFFDEPVTGEFLQLFVNAINAENAQFLYRPILRGELTLSDPTPVNEPDIEQNTKLVASVTTSDLYKGSAEFHYNRLNLNHMSMDRVLVKSLWFSEHWEAAVAAGATLGVTLTEDDVVPAVLPLLAPGQIVDINIQIKPTSKGFTGPLNIRFQRAV